MKQKGISIVFVLIFGAVFITTLAGFIGLIAFRYQQASKYSSSIKALHIAEAGINYYKWRLIQDENDVQDGHDWCCTEPPCSICGPYEHDYYDPQGRKQGQFILEIEKQEICGQVLGIYVSSTGVLDKFPDVERKVKAKFAATSIADYAYILNDSVWAGEDRNIFGRYHSNGGIRMDGTHNSLVSSASSEWLCTSSFGCDWRNCPFDCYRDGSACRCPGVFGDGSSQDLWWYPALPFDFAGITSDLANIKTLSQSIGKYYPPSVDLNPMGRGYHVIFNPDGTFDIRIITGLSAKRAYDTEKGWYWFSETISSEVNYEIGVSLGSACQLLFVEDNIWVEGVVSGRKTLASANLINPTVDTTAIINGDLEYTSLDGTDSLAVIAEQDIYIPLYSPDDMIVRGVFVAQKGHFGRNHYSCFSYPSDCKKDSLTIYGSIVSYGRVGTQWVYSSGSLASGYAERFNYFDEKLSRDPPPLLPYVSNALEVISWEEIQ